MSIFAVTAMSSGGIGPVFAGWTEMNPLLGWKWIQWIQLLCVNPLHRENTLS
jgi:hypothetical protein